VGKRLIVGVLVVVLGLAVGVGFLVFKETKRHADGHARMQQLPSARLRQLALGVRTFAVEHEKLPASLPLTPQLGACCPAGTCMPSAQRWEGWTALAFSIDEPHAYSYELVVTEAGFTARAIGDLDCDGEYATYEQQGDAEGRATTTSRNQEME
jgi:hypothetical protein